MYCTSSLPTVCKSKRNIVYVSFVFSAQQWLLSPEPSRTMDSDIILVENLIISQDYTESSCPMTWLRRALVMNQDHVRHIAELTCGQRDNPLWACVRKLRFTASNFGPLLKAASLKRYFYMPYKCAANNQCHMRVFRGIKNSMGKRILDLLDSVTLTVMELIVARVATIGCGDATGRFKNRIDRYSKVDA